MKIAIAGLGLIGGSFAKAIRHRTDHFVMGYDHSAETLELALAEGAIQQVAEDDFSAADLILVALYPGHVVEFIQRYLPTFKKGAVVVDLCGVKRSIYDQLAPLLAEHGMVYIGGHPMAGRECSGFQNASPTLFEGASMILTPPPATPSAVLAEVEGFFASLGFAHMEVTTPQRHDEMIAYTSQLAHVVSSAYIRSPVSRDYRGFSAGSFKDLTRVAKLNEGMWSELFLHNGDYLSEQIQVMIDNLEIFRDSIRSGDQQTLLDMLREGRELKEKLG